jgi:hypothetical protein
MKHIMKSIVLICCAVALLSLAGCANDNPSSGGSIAPSGSSTGSLGAGH